MPKLLQINELTLLMIGMELDTKFRDNLTLFSKECAHSGTCYDFTLEAGEI